jgi:hypothetical protein
MGTGCFLIVLGLLDKGILYGNQKAACPFFFFMKKVNIRAVDNR